MTPQEHVERAELLTTTVDGLWDNNGVYVGSGGFLSTPPVLTLAQVHLQIADMKLKVAA